MSPEFILGLVLLFFGSIGAAFPKPADYITRLIHLEVPGWGLFLIMLSFDETLALFTFGGVSALSTFIFARVIQKRGNSD